MRRYAILISTETYDNFPPTPYCHNDAALLREVLTSKCDYPEENTLHLRLDKDNSLASTDLLAQIDNLLDRSNEGDSILFYYAGHGEAINEESYLILPGTTLMSRETTSLKLTDLTHYLSKNKRLNIRIYDTCHSGQNIRASEPKLNTEGFVQNILLNGGEGSVTFASCAIDQKSYWDEDLKHGIFTYSLAKTIEDFPVNSDIEPEILKIEVCKRVQRWCEVQGKTQTPTFNAHLNGNMPIAYRKTDPQPKAPPPLQRPISERLTGMRSVDLVDLNIFPILKTSVEELRQKFHEKSVGVDFHGTQFAVAQPSRCDDLASFLRQKIVIKMQNEDSLHHLEIVREEARQPAYLTAYDQLFAPKPEIVTRYYLSQSEKMPPCFVDGTIATDGYVPKSSLFFYVCPLQASIALLFGYYFDVSYFADESEIVDFNLKKKIFSINDFRSKKYFDFIDPLMAAFETDLDKQIVARLNRIDEELQKIG